MPNPVLTVDKRKAITEHVRNGQPLNVACEREEVGYSAAKTALHRGRRQLEEHRTTGARLKWAGKWARDVEVAQAQAKGELIEMVRALSQQNPKVALDFLGRLYPQEYGPKATIVHEYADRVLDAVERVLAPHPVLLDAVYCEIEDVKRLPHEAGGRTTREAPILDAEFTVAD